MIRKLSRRRLRRWLRSEPLADPAAVLDLHDEARDDLIRQAHRAFSAGRIEEAERLYVLLGSLWSSQAAAQWLGLGACRQVRGDFAEAETCYDRCLERDPGNPHALTNRAEVRLRTGRAVAASEDLRAALDRLAQDKHLAALQERVQRLWELAAAGAMAEGP